MWFQYQIESFFPDTNFQRGAYQLLAFYFYGSSSYNDTILSYTTSMFFTSDSK